MTKVEAIAKLKARKWDDDIMDHREKKGLVRYAAGLRAAAILAVCRDAVFGDGDVRSIAFTDVSPHESFLLSWRQGLRESGTDSEKHMFDAMVEATMDVDLRITSRTRAVIIEVR